MNLTFVLLESTVVKTLWWAGNRPHHTKQLWQKREAMNSHNQEVWGWTSVTVRSKRPNSILKTLPLSQPVGPAFLSINFALSRHSPWGREYNHQLLWACTFKSVYVWSQRKETEISRALCKSRKGTLTGPAWVRAYDRAGARQYTRLTASPELQGLGEG